MSAPYRLFVVSLAAAALSIPVQAAHESESEPSAGPRVILYERPNFRGDSLEIAPGQTLDNLAYVTFGSGKRANDAVSSIFVEEGASVEVFASAHLHGESMRLTRSVENLSDFTLASGPSGGTWDNAISSARTEAYVVSRRPGPGRTSSREPRVIIYREPNFGGDSLEIFPGESFDNLARTSFDGGNNANDVISSIRVIGPVRLVAYSSSGFNGESLEVTQDVRELGRMARSVDGSSTWADCISSLRVERAGSGAGTGSGGGHGSRDDNRPPPRADNPDVLVKRIFKEVLQRDPNESELRAYRSHVIDQNWTADMVRADLRRTREFRQREADVIITRAFEDLLNRKPDPAGLETYRTEIIEHEWSEKRVRDAIRQSDEYRQVRVAAADAIIQRAFRDLLGRDPDPVGLESYRNGILNKGWNEKTVRDAIKKSPEYRNRQNPQPAPQPQTEQAEQTPAP